MHCKKYHQLGMQNDGTLLQKPLIGTEGLLISKAYPAVVFLQKSAINDENTWTVFDVNLTNSIFFIIKINSSFCAIADLQTGFNFSF